MAGILDFYCKVVASNTESDTFFASFSSQICHCFRILDYNLDIGFDLCFFEGMDRSDKAVIQLVFLHT